MAQCPPGPTQDSELPYDVAHEREFYKYMDPNACRQMRVHGWLTDSDIGTSSLSDSDSLVKEHTIHGHRRQRAYPLTGH